jgi:putative tryptophan/tyrosine transport system substrate-binding protein
MQRRKFITLLAAAPMVWPVVSRGADQIRKIGVFWGQAKDDPEMWVRFAAFTQGLQKLGWTEGKNVSFEIRHAVGNPDQIPSMAAELVGTNPDVIVASTAGLAIIARKATNTIPIVVMTSGDLEGSGLIASLRKPGGNVTGIQILSPQLMGKRIEMLRQLVPALTRLGVIEPITPSGLITPRYIEAIVTAARELQIEVHRVPVFSSAEFTAAFSTIVQAGDQAALVISTPLSYANRIELADLAAKNRLPTIYEAKSYAADGGLISYGPDFAQLSRDSASYVDQILRGTVPGDLPVQQPTKFELIVNLKTAKAIGLTISESFLLRADEVIE